MQGGKIRVEIDEQIVYEELHTKRNSIWSLLLASGYLKVVQMEFMEDPAIILEFKVFQPRREKELSDTVQAALKQIEEKQYETTLLNRGIRRSRIRKYGFAFEGQRVLIGEA